MHIRQKHAEWSNVRHVPSLIEKRKHTVLDQEVRHATACPAIERHSGGTGKTRLVQNPVPLDVSIEIEERLIEVDYGPWGGLTTEQLVERFGADVVEGWEQRCAWPPQWVTPENDVRARVAGLVAELCEACQGQRVLILSSNGVLRYFLESVEGAFEAALAERTFKLKTGRGGRLVPGEAVLAWNAKPHALLGLETPA